jgi:segregation and condensation protein B
MTDERPDSLAAQAASWVPPWERPTRPPDRDYQAAHAEPEPAGDAAERSGSSAGWDQPDTAGQPPEGAKVDEADLSEDDDDFDPAFEGANPSGYEEEVPPELAPLPGEAGGHATVDAPQELPGEDEADPTDVGAGPELPLPDAIEEVADAPAEGGSPVDAPLPSGGDDADEATDAAGEVSDAAGAVARDGELDRSFAGDATDPDGAEREADGEADRPPAGPRPSRSRPGIPPQGRGGAGATAAVGDEAARTEDEGLAGTDLRPMDDAELRAALEAILLVVDEPVAEMQLAQIVEQPTERVAGMLEDISARYTAAGHGFDLRRAAGGWRLYTRPEYAPYVERFVLDGQSVRLTQAALETLAVVAYKQPVTRSRISAIRGVNCDGVMRTLVTRGLIEECGAESETGAFLYRTTALFLEKLGLNSIDQLPPLAPFLPDDVEEVLDASG